MAGRGRTWAARQVSEVLEAIPALGGRWDQTMVQRTEHRLWWQTSLVSHYTAATVTLGKPQNLQVSVFTSINEADLLYSTTLSQG